jgi:hypothetical protein
MSCGWKISRKAIVDFYIILKKGIKKELPIGKLFLC